VLIGTVGTVVNNEGDGDVFAFATILPYTSIQVLNPSIIIFIYVIIT